MSNSKMTIELAVNFLQLEAEKYKKEYDRIAEERKNALENAKKSFIGQALKDELSRIEKVYGENIVKARHEAMKAVECLNELRENELAEVQGIDKNTIDKINAIADIQMTEDEFSALMDDVRVSSNYWAKRALMQIAEKSNIDVVKTGIGADYSTKLNVLSQLEKQLTEIVEKYPCDNDKYARPKVMYANLSPDVLKRAVAIYGGKLDLKTEEEKADKSILHIKAQQTDLNRALAISNAFRNSKTEENKNRLLYALSTDAEISDLSLQMSGVYDEIIDFRETKSKDYANADRAMQRIRDAKHKDSVDMVINENQGNSFFEKMYNSEIKRNEFLRSFAADVPEESAGVNDNE